MWVIFLLIFRCQQSRINSGILKQHIMREGFSPEQISPEEQQKAELQAKVETLREKCKQQIRDIFADPKLKRAINDERIVPEEIGEKIITLLETATNRDDYLTKVKDLIHSLGKSDDFHIKAAYEALSTPEKDAIRRAIEKTTNADTSSEYHYFKAVEKLKGMK
jgi:hypothetical protein